MKLNTDNCPLLLNTQKQNILNIWNLTVISTYPEKLLDITLDCK